METKLEGVNFIRDGLEEKFIGSDGIIRFIFRENNCFKQYKFVGEGVYIFEKEVSVDGSQLKLDY